MDLKAGKHLVAPAINNISCSEDRFAKVSFLGQLHPFDVLQALFIVFLTFLVISANLMVILIINSRRYAAYIHPQPRYLLTSLALNDLAIGVLIIPFGALPALLHCWPYGEIFCQIQVRHQNFFSRIMVNSISFPTGFTTWSFITTKCCYSSLYGGRSVSVRAAPANLPRAVQ